jgi:two-component sensor histidine kinase
VRIEGPPTLIEPNIAQAIAIVLHELATNAAKYGSLSQAGGRIELAWNETASCEIALRWTESGGPPVEPPTRRGFGSRVIERMIVQTGGAVHFDWRREGLVCNITLRV